MKIVIFGASGRTGIPLVQQGLEQGHEITAFVRNKGKLPVQHDRLRVVEGDVLNKDNVSDAIAGQDAVIVVLGHVKGGSAQLLQNATNHIVAGMKQHGVNRLVNLTGAAVSASKDVKQGLMSRIIGGLLKRLAKPLYLDSLAQKQLIEQSDTDWTIVRAPRLVDGPVTGQYRTGYIKFDKPMITRSDVAHFMLKEAVDGRFIREYPLIGS